MVLGIYMWKFNCNNIQVYNSHSPRNEGGREMKYPKNSELAEVWYKKGKAEVLKDEIRWQKEYLELIKKKRKDMAGLQLFYYPVRDRIEVLNEFLKEMEK